MVVIGVLLMLGCVALATDAVVQNTGAMHVIAFNQSIASLSPGELFVAGAALGLLFALGMATFTGGIGRASRRRRERRALRRDSAETETLRAEKSRLEQQLAAERATSTDGADAYPDGRSTSGDSEPVNATTASGKHRLTG